MDEEGFKQRFMPLHPRLYRVAFALIGNAQDAEDVLQEAYCKLWDKRNELTLIQNCEAFCVTLTRNMCLDYLRSGAHKRRQENSSDPVAVVSDFSPETALIERDKTEVVNKLINELPENQRQVIRLRGIDGCSVEEIEQITGLSAVNVRVLLSRARKTVRKRFDRIMNCEL